MDDIKEQLLANKIIDKKRLRQVEHEERVRRKALGRDGIEAERQQVREAIEARQKEMREQDREKDREQEAEHRDGMDEQERISQLQNLVSSGAIREGIFGTRRFFFTTRERKMPFLNVSDEIAGKIEYGRAAIAEVPGGTGREWVIVSREAADRMRAIDPDSVCFLNVDPPRRRDSGRRTDRQSRGRRFR